MTGIGTAPGSAVLAENVRDFQPGTSHRQRLSRCLFPSGLAGFGLLRLVRLADQLVDRAGHRGDDAGRHVSVMRRRLKPVMAEQRLDQPDVRAALKQVGGEAVPPMS